MVVRIAVMLPVANEAGNAGNAFTGVCLSMGVGGAGMVHHIHHGIGHIVGATPSGHTYPFAYDIWR